MLNRNVAQSERASALARQLEGRGLSLVFEGTPLMVSFRVADGRITLDTRDAGGADATLSGSPISLLSLVGPGAEDRLRGSSIRIAGDAEVAQRFRDLLQHAQPDFEEEPAHRPLFGKHVLVTAGPRQFVLDRLHPRR